MTSQVNLVERRVHRSGTDDGWTKERVLNDQAGARSLARGESWNREACRVSVHGGIGAALFAVRSARWRYCNKGFGGPLGTSCFFTEVSGSD